MTTPADGFNPLPCPTPDAADDCASPTTPVTSVGLCLADGTPIAVTAIRDCDGAITSEGWLNLTTGAWSAGAAPAGAAACGDARSIQVSGTFCSVDDVTGDVLALVLVEYSYDDTGAIASVRLVDAVTGTTYVVPAGASITTCPAGVQQPEKDLIQLCDTAADGTVTPFVRDYARDENGVIVGRSDYTLDGATYVPAGVVGTCTDPCRNTTSVLLCDAPSTSQVTVTPAIADSNVAAIGQTQFQNHAGPYTPLWSGNTLIYPAGPGPEQQHLAAVGRLTADMTGCEDATATLTVSVRVRNDGPDAGQSWDGALRLFRGTTMIASDDALTWAPVGWQGTLTVSAPVTPAELTAGDLRVGLMLETYHLGAKQWTADQFDASIVLEGCEEAVATQFLRHVITDCETGDVVTIQDTTLDGAEYTVTGEVGQCVQADEPVQCCSSHEPLPLCDVAADGTSTNFLRHYTYGTSGVPTGYANTLLDGQTAYEPSGTVKVCAPGDTELVELCDLQPDGFIIPFLLRTTYDGDGNVLSTAHEDADGNPYTVTGSAVVCSQVQRQSEVLCDVNAGVSTPFLRTWLSATGQVLYVFDTTLNGTTGYAPTGTVGKCCGKDCDVIALCDVQQDVSAVLPSVGTPTRSWQDLANGVRWMRRGSDGVVPGGWYGADNASSPERFDFDRPVSITYSVRFSSPTAAPLRIPAGWYLNGLNVTQHAWDAETRTISPTASATQAGQSTFTTEAPTTQVMMAPVVVGTQPSGQTSQYGQITVRADQVTPFLRTLCMGDGGAAPVTDTALDGTTPYTPVGTVRDCAATNTATDYADGSDTAEVAPVTTGARNVTGVATQQLATEFPGLQSVTLTVLSGTVLATMTDGANVAVPAGTSLTWSVVKGEDSSLTRATFVGSAAAANYLLNWTRR